MLDIETTKNIVKDIAEKYHFLQKIDIERIENADFNRQNYMNIYGKPFVFIREYKSNEYLDKIEITFGKINIEVDTIDEEEYYSIDDNIFFVVDISEFTGEDSLIEIIIQNCKKYNLI